MTSPWFRTLIGLIVSAIFLIPVLTGNRPELIDRFEYDLYDLRLRGFTQLEPDPRIVIVDIDDKSLSQVGRWPWSRSTLADLLDALFDQYETVLVGFDIVFSEPDTRIEIREIQARIEALKSQGEEIDSDSLIAGLSNDQRLADSVSDRLVVLGYLFDNSPDSVKAGIPGVPVVSDPDRLSGIPIPNARGIISSIETLQSRALWSGFFDNPRVDRDGVYRRVPLLQEYEGEYYPSLPLSMMLMLLGETEVEPQIETDSTGALKALTAINVGGYPVPVDEEGSILVPYRGPQGSFSYLSAVDVITGEADAEVLNGAIVMIGTSAAGLLDLRVTPVGTRYAGVEVHANILSAMLDERFLHQPDYSAGVELVQLGVTALLLSVIIPFSSVLVSLSVALVWLGLVAGFNFYAWTELNWVIPLGYTLVLAVNLFLILQISGYFFESRRTAKLTSQFGQYIPPEVVKQLSAQGREVSLSGESRELTIFFSDVRSFTSISEGLTPQQITRLMNIYLSEMTSLIHQRKGTIDKYIGDAIMAFWGAPVADDQHAQHALRAALAMQSHMVRVNEMLAEESLPKVSVGMGLHSGIANVGNMGSSFRTAYTAMGDAVNLASRLEGLTKSYHCGIVVSETVKEQNTDVLFRTLDLVQVKGRDRAVDIFEPIGFVADITESEQAIWRVYEEGIALYRAADWEQAQQRFETFLVECPDDKVADIYLGRISTLLLFPPEGEWSPVHKHATK